MSRQVEIPEELVTQIDSVRGETSFEQWLALAIAEKVWGSRFSTVAGFPENITHDLPVAGAEELWIAKVQLPDGQEHYLLWRYAMSIGMAMYPVFASSEQGMRDWEEMFANEINFMDGPPIVWRHYEGGEETGYLRAPPPEQNH